MKRQTLFGRNKFSRELTFKTVFSNIKSFINITNILNYFFKIQTFMSD